MNERLPHDIASDAEAEDGHVFVEGPDGIAYAMTPQAAAETSKRLKRSAADAQQQQAASQRRQ
jgi:hypothetical protein